MRNTDRKPPAAGKGRPKGAKNKMTLAAHVAMDMAFNGLGGWAALMKWAKDNETEFYKLWAKRIKAEVEHSGDPDKPLGVTLRFGNMDIPL